MRDLICICPVIFILRMTKPRLRISVTYPKPHNVPVKKHQSLMTGNSLNHGSSTKRSIFLIYKSSQQSSRVSCSSPHSGGTQALSILWLYLPLELQNLPHGRERTA